MEKLAPSMIAASESAEYVSQGGLEWLAQVNDFLWGPFCLLALLTISGFWFTYVLKGVQVTMFTTGFKRLFGDFSLSGAAADDQGMSSFQALTTAVAAQVGTGTLVGAMTAIIAGGPGAIFWVWVAAFFGMATAFSEACLAQIYKTTNEQGQIVGGPAYYISIGLGNTPFSKKLAVLFACVAIALLGFTGSMVQANSISDAFNSAFGLDARIMGVILAIAAGLIFMGGAKSIASLTEKVVPIMAITYIVVGFIIIAKNGAQIPGVVSLIFKSAFDPQAAWGGVLGVSAMTVARYGIARGLFSNEAGMGSTPHAHAVAKVNHPVEQGLLGIISVFITTFVILSITAFAVLTSDVIVFQDGQSTLTGIAVVQEAFSKSLLGGFGHAFIAICLLFFAFSTIVGWYYFAETNVRYLFGSKAIRPFQFLVMAFIFLGSILKVALVWQLADFFNAIMVIPNLIALLLLSGKVARVLKEYKEGVKYDQKSYW